VLKRNPLISTLLAFIPCLSHNNIPSLTTPWILSLVYQHLNVTLVYWWSAHLIPLPKLPYAKETADLIFKNVVRIHGIPVDIVSDRGPQFMSRYWKAFWSLFGSSVSLSSGFHPQKVKPE